MVLAAVPAQRYVRRSGVPDEAWSISAPQSKREKLAIATKPEAVQA
jgi:hypothetical protein